MKRVLLFVFALLTIVISWAQAPLIEGLTYHEEDGGYYAISSSDDLWTLYHYYSAEINRPALVFKMTQDIDMADNTLSPIAWTTLVSLASNRYFNGTFDGNGHTISNLTIIGDYNYTGFFYQLSSSAIVKNLTLSNCVVRYNGTTLYRSVGGIAGRNYGTIENCTVTGIVSNYDNRYDVGGIVGENLNPGKVINCTSVTGRPVVGILYGSTNSGTASGCHAYYRIDTNSAVDLTISLAPLTIVGMSCYNEGTTLNVTVTPNDDKLMFADEVIFTNTSATRTAYGSYRLSMPASDVNV